MTPLVLSAEMSLKFRRVVPLSLRRAVTNRQILKNILSAIRFVFQIIN